MLLTPCSLTSRQPNVYAQEKYAQEKYAQVCTKYAQENLIPSPIYFKATIFKVIMVQEPKLSREKIRKAGS